MATLATVEAYLTAAQTAFGNSDYTTARKQIILGEIELNKLMTSDGLDGEITVYRQSFTALFDHIKEFEETASQGARRSIAERV